MSYIVNSSEMKRVDSFTIHNIGMPSMVLMERAALCVCEELFDGVFDLKRVVVICGSGNNGGDGFAIARLLHLKNIDVKILFAGEEKKCTDETLQQMKIAQNYGIDIFKEIELEYCTTIVDALFGIGLLRPIEGYLASLIDKINNSGVNVLSVDIPSGISTDTGQIMGSAIKARKTVTFAYKKLGLTLPPGLEYAGIVKVKDIGITDIGFDGVYPLIKTNPTYE